MGRFRKVLKWGFMCGLVLLVLLAAAWAVSRAMYPTEGQREAVAEMLRQPEYAGENAFALLWTLDRDVPDEALEAVIAEDVGRFTAKPAMPEPGDAEAWQFESAAEDYPDLGPSDEDRDLFCASREKNCLERVREDLDAYTALVERNRKLLDRLEKLRDHDFVQFEFPYRLTTPMPSYQGASLLRTRHAVRFAQGNEQEAVAATCRDIATWRRLGAHSDNLITRLVGASYAANVFGHSLANMLSELPTDTPLPEPCEQALAPPTVEDVSLCDAMRGEFRMATAAMKELPGSMEQTGYLDRLAWAILFDAEATVGIDVEGARQFCSESERERLHADQREVPEPPQQDIWRFACIGNPIGCMLTSIARSSYAGYRHRLQDYGAKLRVLGTLAWMRRQADEGRSPSELLAARPDELRSPQRNIVFGPDGRTLRVLMYDTARSEYWSIPLPPALHSTRGD